MNIILEIMSHIPVWMLLMLSAASVIVGDFMAKYWSTNQRPIIFFLSILGYFFSGFFYIPTLLREGLVVTSIIWSLLSIVGFIFIGLVIFDEILTTIQIIGIVFGIISFIILTYTLH